MDVFKRIIGFGGLVLTLTFISMAFLSGCEKGEHPIGPDTEVVDSIPDPETIDTPVETVIWQNGDMNLIVDPSRLPATYGDTAYVTVSAYDNYHNPIINKTVTFWSNIGKIMPGSTTTDTSGNATAKFMSVPVNAEAVIIANLYLTPDSVVQRSHNVTLFGLEVVIRPQAYNVLVDNVVPVTIEVNDGSGSALANDSLIISGSLTDTLVTLGNGTAITTVTRADSGEVTLVATSHRGATDTAVISFWKVIPPNLGNPQGHIRQMRIYSSRAQLNADNTDYADITVILIDENNNPAQGDTVLFSSDLGVIGQSAVVDSSGRATVMLQSAPINGVCTIEAIAVSTGDTVSTQVLFGGISLQLTADPSHLNYGDTATLEALLRDGSGMPIGGDLVSFTVSGDAFFIGGNTLENVVLGPDGKAAIRLTASSACSALVSATTLNTRDSTIIEFTNNALSLAIAPNQIVVGGADSTLVIATYYNGMGSPVRNVPVIFASNAGIIRTPYDTTNSSGKAYTWILSSDFTGEATITVQASEPDTLDTWTVASDTAKIQFVAGPPARIDAAVTPDNIQVNGGVATIIATVTDTDGNMVSGANVNFKIIDGPGGGEYIIKPLVECKDGEARTQIYSGSVPSMLLGVKISVFVGSISDTTKLTISGKPFAVSIARPQSDTVKVDDVGLIDESVFDYYMGAVVKDVNGNPVADGTEVHFSAVVAGMAVHLKRFDKWLGVGSLEDIKPKYFYFTFMVPFEDINHNYTMDNGIDLKLDFNDAVASRGDDVNGDGVCDYDPASGLWDFWWDFNGNGVCDPGVAEPLYSDEGYTSIYADLNDNGAHDTTELLIDYNGNGVCDLPPSGDFRFSLWEGLTQIFSRTFRFDDNNYSIVINKSAVTQGGVAYVRLTYPRQFARKLYILVDAEIQGIRDIHTEPFILPVIVRE
jgi:hypothetical protein